ncbi:MAG: DUF1592 domain-containing protein [Deltaproteobacteria bacterium]|nr:DUF1592 domain-containing protein [Deltaproteobacteria bacterium]
MASAAGGCTGTIESANPSNGANAPTGTVGGSSGRSTSYGPAADLNCVERSQDPGAAALRRLSHIEYDNTVRDLLSTTSKPARDFIADGISGDYRFRNRIDRQLVGASLAAQYFEAAFALATEAVDKRIDSLVPCPAAARDDACASKFIDAFGKRAFRRPLDVVDKSTLLATFLDGRAGADFKSGIKVVIATILQSPQFLYRVEVDTGVALVSPDDWEMASRLSYLLWQSMPDNELFDAAAAGKLKTREQISLQVTRLTADPRSRATVATFHEQWLGLDTLDRLDKDVAAFPGFDGEIAPRMREEARRLVEHVAFEDDGRPETLLTAPYTFSDDKLGRLYGLRGLVGEGFQKVEASAMGRRQQAGILTLGGVLATHASRTQTSPVQRGKFVRDALLCEQPPPPPDNVDTTLDKPKANETTRERLDRHSQNPSCRGCHRMLDPIGFGLENFDAVGAWRDTDSGAVVDATGEIFGTDVTGAFHGPVELAQRLAGSQQVRRCMAEQWFRFAFGRQSTDEDECTLRELTQRLNTGGIRDMFRALVDAAPFRYRRAGKEI